MKNRPFYSVRKNQVKENPNNINNKQKNNVDSRFCSIYLKYNINKMPRKNKVKDVDNVLNRL